MRLMSHLPTPPEPPSSTACFDASERGTRESRRAGPPPTTFSAVGRFIAGSLVAIAVVVVGAFFALRPIAIEEAERHTREQVQILGGLVETAGLSDGLLRERPAALARLDNLVLSQILSESVMRVKVWSVDGRILYSDQPALIGERYDLGPEERRLFREGGADAELSQLSRPENRYERQEGKLLEAYTPIRTPTAPRCCSRYITASDRSARAETACCGRLPRRCWSAWWSCSSSRFPSPGPWPIASQRGHRDRERLLANAVDASAQERPRIASDLHDGVVQDLAGVAFGLAPLAEDADRRGASREASALRKSIARLRQGIRGLRTLLVEIHPPKLETTGLEAALNDLLSPLEAEGVATEVNVEDDPPAGPGLDPLIYRTANEAIRNVRAHSGATEVRVSVTRPEPGRVRLLVEDNGRGFSDSAREERAAEGHLGLSLLEGLVSETGGTLTVESDPGQGTTVELTVPA